MLFAMQPSDTGQCSQLVSCHSLMTPNACNASEDCVSRACTAAATYFHCISFRGPQSLQQQHRHADTLMYNLQVMKSWLLLPPMCTASCTSSTSRTWPSPCGLLPSWPGAPPPTCCLMLPAWLSRPFTLATVRTCPTRCGPLLPWASCPKQAFWRYALFTPHSFATARSCHLCVYTFCFHLAVLAWLCQCLLAVK